MKWKWVVVVAVVMAPARLAGQAASKPLPTWLVACWERRGTLVTEERWLPPKGGIMLGVSTSVRGDRAVSWEFLRIERKRDRLIYHAFPSGQMPTAFPAITESDTVLVFENLDHDFPQRVIYRRTSADSLHARIEGVVRDTLRGVDFRYRNVTCPLTEGSR